MATYILLGTLTDEGAERLRENPGWLKNINRDLAAMDVKVIAQYAVLGPYDIVTIVEAPDNKSVVHVSTQLTLRGSIKITTLPAISIEDFIVGLQ
jgi:uncharacterized protein with GYD domain